jgi:UDP-N-acetylglucosamine/UDP-N-acetylgalactosamine diphosphorylase
MQPLPLHAPDGNGNALKRFFESKIWHKWHLAGVEYLNVILIDNPLADPFDAELVGFHASKQADATLKCIRKTEPEEKVGVLVQTDQGIRVIEYSELSTEEKQARNPDGTLLFSLANTSMFCFSMPFIPQIASLHLPIHLVRKQAGTQLAWKQETFIFDLLEHASNTQALLYPREDIYAPLKNLSGNDSLQTVQAALLASDSRRYHQATGTPPPTAPFELDPSLYYS